MWITALALGFKYGPPLVAAIYSFLGHRKAKQNNDAIADLKDTVTTQKSALKG